MNEEIIKGKEIIICFCLWELVLVKGNERISSTQNLITSYKRKINKRI